jgi:hypothetical protein
MKEKVKEKLEDAGTMDEGINRPETVREYFEHPERFEKVKDMEEGRNKKSCENKAMKKQESIVEGQLDDLWQAYNYDPIKLILFLDKIKTYWIVRAAVNIFQEDELLSNMLVDRLQKEIRKKHYEVC